MHPFLPLTYEEHLQDFISKQKAHNVVVAKDKIVIDLVENFGCMQLVESVQTCTADGGTI